jgi:hypothetical protein
MFNAWDTAMMQRSSSSGGSAAAASNGSGGSPQTEAGKAAAMPEDLRSAAAEVSGRMAQDWNNCECRVIELRWGSSAELAAGNEAGSVGQQERFLVARPGGTDAWWPGGLHALN